MTGPSLQKQRAHLTTTHRASCGCVSGIRVALTVTHSPYMISNSDVNETFPQRGLNVLNVKDFDVFNRVFGALQRHTTGFNLSYPLNLYSVLILTVYVFQYATDT